MNKPNIRFQDGQWLDAARLNQAMEAVDASVDATNAAQTLAAEAAGHAQLTHAAAEMLAQTSQAALDQMNQAIGALDPAQSEALALAQQVQKLYSDFAEYDKTDFPDVNFGTPLRTGAYIGADGSFVDNTGYNVSNEIEVTRGTLYKLFVGAGVTIPSGIAVFSKKIITHTSAGDIVSYQPAFVSAGGATPKAGYLVFLATEDMTIVTSYPVGATKLEVSRYGVLASVCTQIDILRVAVDLKSFADGYYSRMRVGLSDDLTPRGEVTPEQISYRKTGGSKVVQDGSASIKTLKGNSAVWNQKIKNSIQTNIKDWTSVQEGVRSRTSYNSAEKALCLEILQEEGWGNIRINGQSALLTNTNKYLFVADVKAPKSLRVAFYTDGTQILSSPIKENAWDRAYVIGTPSIDGSALNVTFVGSQPLVGEKYYFKNIVVYDLTQMFDAGLEPNSYAEFLQRKPKVADEYAYTEGEVVHNHTTAVKSVGVNLWDGKYMANSYIRPDGTVGSDENCAVIDFIPIIGGKDYYFKNVLSIYYHYPICWYDKEKNLIIEANVGAGDMEVASGIAQAPANASYVRVLLRNSRLADICFNLSDPAINGQYFPYEESVRQLPVIAEKFSDGFKSAGSAHDTVEIFKDKTIVTKRFGVKVFDGTEIWVKHGQSIFRTEIDGIKPVDDREYEKRNQGIIIAQYAPSSQIAISAESMGEKTWLRLGIVIFIKDSTCTSVDEWKQYLASLYAAGTPLVVYYELAEPIVEELPAINADYSVWGNGTEENVCEEGTPLKADIVYGISSYKQIQLNMHNIGNLANLSTTAKGDLVAAINELFARIAALPQASNS